MSQDAAMNRRGTRAVRARLARLAITLACVGPGCADGSGLGCDEAQGGAVELSWSLEAPDGQRIERCGDARVGRIRLQWNEGGMGNEASWPCDDRSGVTNFLVPAGETRLWVEPVCVDGFRLLQRSFEAPAPIVRHVEEAELVTLNAVLITVETNCEERCSCVCGDATDSCTDIEPIPPERDADRLSPDPALPGSDSHAILVNPGVSVF
jgi:hypothetical protein